MESFLGKAYGTVVRQTTELINGCVHFGLYNNVLNVLGCRTSNVMISAYQTKNKL